MPYDPTPHRGRAATLDRSAHPDEDVHAARAAVTRTQVPFDSRRRPRTLGDRWWGFVAMYGWRAYALPLLAIVTAAALMTSTAPSSPKQKVAAAPPPTSRSAGAGSARPTTPTTAPAQISLKSDAPGTNADPAVLKFGALPAGGSFTRAGDGTFRILKGTSPKVGSGPLYHYSIDVENGVTGVDLTAFENLVTSTLADPRSWSGHGVSLERVDSGPIDFHVTMTSVLTVRKFCGYTIPVETSCYATASETGGVNRVTFNVARWQRGAIAYLGDLAAYRVYMINHEDGHALGHHHAHQCLPGGLAPVMMQQTFGLKSAATGKLCGANPWPYPPGAKGAPGAEQQDTASNNEYGQ